MKKDRKPFHDSIFKLFRRRWGVKTGLTVLAVVGAVLDNHGSTYEKLTAAVIFILAVFIIDIVYSLYEDAALAHESIASRFQAMAATVDAKLDEISNRIDAQANDVLVARLCAKLQGPVAQVLGRMHSDLRNSLTLLNDGCKIHSHTQILIAYSRFWEVLVELQRKQSSRNLRPLIALVTHSCAIDIWKDPILAHVSSKQKQFIRAGGQIYRILCGDGPEPSPEYWEIATKMISLGVKVKYYNRQDYAEGPEHVSDFIVVEEISQAVIWEPLEAERKIKSAIFTTSLYHNGPSLMDMWKRLDESAMPMTSTSGPYLES